MNQPALRQRIAKDVKFGERVIRITGDSSDQQFFGLIDELDHAAQTFIGSVRDGVSRDRQMATAREVVIVFDRLIKVSTPSMPQLRAQPTPLRVIMEVARALDECFHAMLSAKDANRFGDEISDAARNFYRDRADHARTSSAQWNLMFYDWARMKRLVSEDRYSRWEEERVATFEPAELDEFFRHHEQRIFQRLLNCERTSYDQDNMRLRLPDPLHDEAQRELISAWKLQPNAIKAVDEDKSSGTSK
jgi:hypothetical protein